MKKLTLEEMEDSDAMADIWIEDEKVSRWFEKNKNMPEDSSTGL